MRRLSWQSERAQLKIPSRRVGSQSPPFGYENPGCSKSPLSPKIREVLNPSGDPSNPAGRTRRAQKAFTMVLHITEDEVTLTVEALTETGRKVLQNAQAIDNLRAKIRMIAASVGSKVDFRMRLNVDTFDIGIKEQPGTGHFFKHAEVLPTIKAFHEEVECSPRIEGRSGGVRHPVSNLF